MNTVITSYDKANDNNNNGIKNNNHKNEIENNMLMDIVRDEVANGTQDDNTAIDLNLTAIQIIDDEVIIYFCFILTKSFLFFIRLLL